MRIVRGRGGEGGGGGVGVGLRSVGWGGGWGGWRDGDGTRAVDLVVGGRGVWGEREVEG